MNINDLIGLLDAQGWKSPKNDLNGYFYADIKGKKLTLNHKRYRRFICTECEYKEHRDFQRI